MSEISGSVLPSFNTNSSQQAYGVPSSGSNAVEQNNQQTAPIQKILKRYSADQADYGTDPGKIPPKSTAEIIDPAILISVVTGILNKLSEKQAEKFAAEMENAQPRHEKILDLKLEKIEKQFKKQIEAKELEKKNQVASDVQLGLGVAMTVFGILATIFTAGAASGLMIAGLALGATMTAADVVNRGLKAGEVKYDDPLDKSGHQKKQLDISIGGLVRMAVEDAAANNRFAYPDAIRSKGEQAMEKYRNEVIVGVSVFISIAIAAVSIGLSAGGIVAVKNAAEAAKDGADIVKDTATAASKLANFSETTSANIRMASQVTDIAGDVINQGAAIYQGANTIVMAGSKLEMRMAEAEANRLEAYANSERTGIERIQMAMKNSSSSVNESLKTMAETLAMTNSLTEEITQMS